MQIRTEYDHRTGRQGANHADIILLYHVKLPRKDLTDGLGAVIFCGE